MAEFIKIAKKDELKPGQMKLVELDGERILLANVGGNYYAMAEECTHRGGPLSEGVLEGFVVTCPYHGGRFDVRTGKVVGPPPRRDEITYEVRVDGDGWRSPGREKVATSPRVSGSAYRTARVSP